MNEYIKSKRLINVLILLVIFTFYICVYQLKIYMPCIFKRITGYSCPACGLSRGINQLFSLNILEAINYNLLSIPLVIFIVITGIWVFMDIIKNSDGYIKNVLKFLEKWYILIFIVLVVITIINNINNI